MNGGEAAELNEQVCKLLEQASHFGELLLDCGIRGEKMLTTRMVGETFEQNSEIIWRLLEGGEVLSIGVHGMGGVGKSTLAKGIYNRLLETYVEDSVFWITVSQEFTIKSLQDQIGRLLGVDFLDEDNEDIRAGRLHSALSKRKNVVLIFDDVWRYIDLLKVGCPFSVECCRLIMTTCSLEVCHQIGCEAVIAVGTLGEDEAWKLFHETFTLGKEFNLDPEVEAIAKSVTKLCDGLPLGIITLAASMRGQTTIHAWRNVLVELKECFADQDGMREGEVFKVLKYSFDRLHGNRQSKSKGFNSLQLCFLYLSLYPEDREVNKERLIREFISEGLLDTRNGRRAQFDQGRRILDKLVNACLFEVGSDGRVVKMHDLVRGMALKVCEGKYMALKALILEECEMLEYVPYLGNLKAPRELNLSCTAIREVPKGVEELLNLRFLSMEGADELEVIRSSLLRKLGSLQYVSFPYHLEASIEGIENLKELEEFRGAVESVRDFNCFIKSGRLHKTSYFLLVGAFGDDILEGAYLGYNKVEILRECRVADKEVSGQDIELLEMMECEGLSKCLLDDINNPTSLRHLTIIECGGIEFILSAPESSSRLSHLEKIYLRELEDFKGVIDTPAPASAPAPPQCVFLSLKILYIENCNEMRKLGLPVSGFPDLAEIAIAECGEIEEIFEDEASPSPN